MPDFSWLSLSIGPQDSLERALSKLLQLTSLGAAAELLFVTRDEIKAWAAAGRVPEEYASPIREELAARIKPLGPEYQAGNGAWARYRHEYEQGFGSQAEIAARSGVTKQAVNRAIVRRPSAPAQVEAGPIEPVPVAEAVVEPVKRKRGK